MTPQGVHLGLITVGLGLLLLAGSAGAASALDDDRLSGTWTAPSSVNLEGSTTTHLDAGSIHGAAEKGSPFAATVDAKQIRVDWSWREGERVSGVNGGDDVASLTSSGGHETRNFTDANLTARPLGDAPEAVALFDEAAASRLDSNGTTWSKTTEDETVVRVEQPNETIWVGDEQGRHGFWHEIEESTVETSGYDEARIEGTFRVFLNNVSMDVDTDGEDWSHWTGYRSATEGPVTWFESRVTVLTVVDGTMTLSAKDALTGYSESINAEWDGQLRSPSADGELTGDHTRYHLDASSLELTGQGSLELTPASLAPQALSTTPTNGLSAHVDGNLEVSDNPGIEKASIRDEDDGGPGLLVPGGLLAGLALVGLATRAPVRRRVDEYRASLRERRIQKWMQTADRLTSVREFERAHEWYKRITDTYANHAEAWYSRAACLEELDRHADAAKAYAEANDLIGGDDPELLDLAGAAAWRAGERDVAVEHFVELAKVAPQRLEARAQGEGFRGMADDPRLKELLKDGAQTESYYA